MLSRRKSPNQNQLLQLVGVRNCLVRFHDQVELAVVLDRGERVVDGNSILFKQELRNQIIGWKVFSSRSKCGLELFPPPTQNIKVCAER